MRKRRRSVTSSVVADEAHPSSVRASRGPTNDVTWCLVQDCTGLSQTFSHGAVLPPRRSILPSHFSRMWTVSPSSRARPWTTDPRKLQVTGSRGEELDVLQPEGHAPHAWCLWHCPAISGAPGLWRRAFMLLQQEVPPLNPNGLLMEGRGMRRCSNGCRRSTKRRSRNPLAEGLALA